MIRINLLPREIYVEDAKRQLRQIGVAIGATVIFFMVAIFLWQIKIKRSEEARNVELNADLRKYEAIVVQVNELEQTRNLLRARRDVIKQLLVGRLVYPKFFEDFMALLPSEIWVTSMSTNLDPQGVMTVTINAQSLSNFAIADWLTNLQSSPLCSDVKLGAITSQDQGEGKATILGFNIVFRYLRKDA